MLILAITAKELHALGSLQSLLIGSTAAVGKVTRNAKSAHRGVVARCLEQISLS